MRRNHAGSWSKPVAVAVQKREHLPFRSKLLVKTFHGRRVFTLCRLIIRVRRNTRVMLIERVSRYIVDETSALSTPVNCLTAAHKSLVLVLELMRLRRDWLRLTMSLPILKARALAFSVWPARIRRFFLRSFALICGVI